ncbi:hypothetical protein DYB28_004232 [Aphanomyces astaci]|uniref:Ankyrin repeat-containing domain n=1 Tax=Aphanomyces astaci TaxID=112090 RepID=A0A9X8HAS9_APHAT|nr:hypothetical protein DYB28_004232 [Aphanomyces astaci]
MVLFSRNLIRLVASYQTGMALYMLPLVELAGPRMTSTSRCCIDLNWPTSFRQLVETNHTMWTAWRCQESVEVGLSRLPHVFATLRTPSGSSSWTRHLLSERATVEAPGAPNSLDQWFRLRLQGRCTTDAMDGAAANGHLAMVQYLHLHTTAGCTSSTVDKAIEHNHVHVAQWLVDRQLVQNYNSRHSMFAAAANGNLKALEWLMSTRMAYMASRRGYVDVVAYLQQLQPEVQVDLISLDFAAATGHLSMVKWLLTHRPAAG